MQKYLIFAIGLIVLVVVFAPSLEQLSAAGPPDSDATAHGEVAAPVVAGGGMTIDRDAGGQFHLTADVNGHPVSFLVDTGSDGVALTEADAAAVGIIIDPSAYAPVARTASGAGYGAHVMLDRVEIAGQDLSGVDAVVLRGLGVSLLGQSVLRRVGSVSVTGDHMTLGK